MVSALAKCLDFFGAKGDGTAHLGGQFLCKSVFVGSDQVQSLEDDFLALSQCGLFVCAEGILRGLGDLTGLFERQAGVLEDDLVGGGGESANCVRHDAGGLDGSGVCMG